MSKLFGKSGGGGLLGGMSNLFGSAGGGSGLLGDLTGIFGNLSSSLGGLGSSLSGIFGSVGGASAGGLAAAGGILQSITGGGKQKTSLGATLGTIAGSVFGPLGGAVGGALGGTLGKIFKFAKGGLVTRPTLGLVGEAGPKLILPLKQFQTLKARSQKIHDSFTQSPLYNDMRRLGETLDRRDVERIHAEDAAYAEEERIYAEEDARRAGRGHPPGAQGGHEGDGA